jgi:hypothetical protein
MKEEFLQGSLFEEDYLIRTLGSLVSQPDIALTELVANAWDAGATVVQINIPSDLYGEIIVEDDGTGLTPEMFRKRWMTLGYNRLKYQGEYAEFPPGRENMHRRAFGRNGVGRHGMLCFANQYLVQTCRDGIGTRFIVSVDSGVQPFKLISEETFPCNSHGTKLVAKVERNLPNVEEIREILSARFLYDPQFRVLVNGKSIDLTQHKGLIDQTTLRISDTLSLELYVIDSSKMSKTTKHHGVAFWVGNRLVGEPSWNLGGISVIDGRTAFAKRHTIVVKSDNLYNEVLPDWSGFKKSEVMDCVFKKIESYVDTYFRNLMKERIIETRKTVLSEHRAELTKLPALGKFEVSKFVEDLTNDHPTIQPDLLSAAVKAIIQLEKTRSGVGLLQKISKLSEEDIEGLNKLLDEWSVKDALTVLDEIDKRLLVIEALERFSSDPDIDELNTLHPLVIQARWLFGPEFDSPLYTSNVSLTNAVYRLFDKKVSKESFVNPRNRPDIIVVGNSTISAVCSEEFSEQNGLVTMRRILVIELKRGGFSIGREELNQANNYVDDLLNCGLLDGDPYINAFVVGHSVDQRIGNSRIRKVGDPEKGRVEVTTYGQLVRTAQQRLFKLKNMLNSRYKSITDESLVEKVLKEPEQMRLFEDIESA